MSGETSNRLARAISEAAPPLPEIQAAFLFGSRASGRSHADSDIDVAFLLDAELARADGHAQRRRLLEALSPHIAADLLDIVILNDAPPALAFQVLKDGKLVLENDRVALHRFRVKTYSRHSDFEPVERFFRNVTRRRASARAGRG